MVYINDANSPGELARLDHQAGLVGKVTGLLPALLEDTDFTTVLDVGCGPGRWALDMAFRWPDVEVAGIDISPSMITYANARAQTQHLMNVSFGVHDFLEHELSFTERSFDLITVRFALGWVKGYANWLLFLSRCSVLLKPGGWIVITEGEGIYTTSLALERLQELLCTAFFKTGYSLSPSPRFMGVVAQMKHLLYGAGFELVQTETNLLDYSHYNEEENRAWLKSFQLLISESSPFLLSAGITTTEELVEMTQRIAIEMYEDDFCGMGPLVTFFARKPGKEDGYA